jgi:hypothetical protein
MPKPTRAPVQEIVERVAPRLKYPYLFVVLLVLFVADLFIPDAIPFVDELMLGLLTFLVGSWRTRRKTSPETVEVSASTPDRPKTPPER